MQVLCELFGKSKQAYYQHDDERTLSKAAMRSFALDYAREIREKDPGMGMLKIWYMYQKKFRMEQDILGRDAFVDLLEEEGMKVRLRIRKPRTTDSSHDLPLFPNLVRDFIPDAPNQLFVSDITYIEIWINEVEYKFCYLSLIMDAYTKEIAGWSVGDTLETAFPLEALRMALRRLEGIDHNAIHHSDRGVQYASRAYTNLLKENHISISMTESGDPKEDSQAEHINNTMKNELLKGLTFNNIEEVRSAVAKAVEFYNNLRPHMSLGMLTPAQAASLSGEIKKNWRSYREEAIKEKQKVRG